MARRFGDRVVRPGSPEARALRRRPRPAPAPRAIPIFRKPTQPGVPAAVRHRRFEVQQGQTQQRVRTQREKAIAELGRQPHGATERRRAAARADQRTATRGRIRRSYRPDVIQQLLAGRSPGLPGGAGVPGLTPRQVQALSALGQAQREYKAAAKPDSLAGSLLNPVDLAVAAATGGGSLLAKGALKGGARAALEAAAERGVGGASVRGAAGRIAARAGSAARGGAARRAAAARRALEPQNLRAAAYTRGARAATGVAVVGAAGAGGQGILTQGATDIEAHTRAFKKDPGAYISRSPGGAYGILAGLGTAAANVGLSGKRLVFGEPHALEPAKQAFDVLVGGTLDAAKLYGSGSLEEVQKHAEQVGAGELLAGAIPLGHLDALRPFRGAGRRAVRTRAQAARALRTERILQAAAEGRKVRRPGRVREELGLGLQRRPSRPGAEPERLLPVFERHGKRKPIAEAATREEVFKRSLHDRIAKRVMLPAIDALKVPEGTDLGTVTSAIALIAQKVSATNGAKAITQLERIVHRSESDALDVVGSQPHAAAWLLQELHQNPNFIRESGLAHATAAYKRAQQIRKGALQRSELLGPRGELVQRHAALKPIMFEHGVPPAEQRLEVPGGGGPEFLAPAKSIPEGRPGRPADVLRAIDRVMSRPEQFIGKTKPGATEPSQVKLREEVERDKVRAVSDAARLHDKAGTLIAEANLLDRQARERPQARHVEGRRSKVEQLQDTLKALRRERQKLASKPGPKTSIPTTRAREAPQPAEPTPAAGVQLPPHAGGEWHPVTIVLRGGFKLPAGAYVRRSDVARLRRGASAKARAVAHTDFEVVRASENSYLLRNIETGSEQRFKASEVERNAEKWQELKPGPAPKETVERRALPKPAKEGALGEEKVRVHPELAQAPDDLALYQRRLERDVGASVLQGHEREFGFRLSGVDELYDELVRKLDRDEASADVVSYGYLSARDSLAHDTGPRPRQNAGLYDRLERGDTDPLVQDFAYEVAREYSKREAPETDYVHPLDLEPAKAEPTPMEGPPKIKGKRFESPKKYAADVEQAAEIIRGEGVPPKEQLRQELEELKTRRAADLRSYEGSADRLAGLWWAENQGRVHDAIDNKAEQPNFEGEVVPEKPTYGAGETHEAAGLFTPTENLKGQTGLTDSELGLETGKPGGLFARTRTPEELAARAGEVQKELNRSTTTPERRADLEAEQSDLIREAARASNPKATTRAGEAAEETYRAVVGQDDGAKGHIVVRAPDYNTAILRGQEAAAARGERYRGIFNEKEWNDYGAKDLVPEAPAAATSATLEGRSGTPPAPETTAGAAAAAPVNADVQALDRRISGLEQELRKVMRKQAGVHVPTKDELRSQARSKRNLARTARRRAVALDKKSKALTKLLGKPMGDAELTAAINDANVIRRAEEIGVPAWVHQENALKVAREAGIPIASGGRRGSGSRIFRRGDKESPHGVLEAMGLQDSTLDTLWAKSMAEPMDSAALERFHQAAARKLEITKQKYTVEELADAFASGELNPAYVVAVPESLHAALREGRRIQAEQTLARMRTIGPNEPLEFYRSLAETADEGRRTPAKGEPTFTLWDREGFKEYRAQLERQVKIESGLMKMNRFQAAAVLSTSLAWVPYQLVAEGGPLLATTSPHKWVALSRDFKRLPIRAQAAIDAYHGSYGFGLGLGKPEVRLRLRPGQPELLLDARGGFLGTKFGRAIREYGAPWGWLRHVDAWKGEQFRNIMALNHMHKAMEGLWRGTREFSELEGKILEDMKGRPFHEQAAWFTRHPDWMESMGATVKNMLGDWNTLSSKERIVSGLAFFYNMLRYTTRFVFWTFPRAHPLKAALLYWWGEQNTEQVRRLLGGDPAYIQALMQSLLFTGTDPSDPGQVTPLNVARASPGGQALVQAAFRGPFTISTFGLAQPLVGILDSAIHGTDPYSGQNITPERAIQAKGYVLQPNANGTVHRDMTGAQKGALFLSQVLRLPAGIRNLEDKVAGGRQTGALPFTGRKMPTDAGEFSRFYQWALPDAGQRFKQSVVPFASQPLVKQNALNRMQRSLDQITYAKEIAKKGGTGNRTLDRRVMARARDAQREVSQLLQLPGRHGG